MHLSKRNHFFTLKNDDREIDLKGVKWEREDGLGAKSKNLRLIIMYEIYGSGHALLIK